jgi:MFS family permease
MVNKSNLKIAYIGWALVAFFFCYQYVLRVKPGVISQELRHTFHMTAEQFSTLGAFYMYAYSFLQIPLGFVVDRIGVKRTVLFSMLLCLSGTILLLKTDQLYLAQLSRVLVGAGSACAFMCSLKWVTDNFPAGKRGFLMGATLTLGTIGALSAGKPLVMIVDAFSWQEAVQLTTIIGLFLFMVIFLFLKDHHIFSRQQLKKVHILSDLKVIASNRSVVIYAVLAIGLYTPLSVLADLWGTSFVMEKYAFSRADAASTTMVMYLGLAVGSLILPWICEKYHIFNRCIQLCGIALIFLFAFVLYGPSISIFTLKIVFFILGFFCGAEMICFTGAVLDVKPAQSGLTIGFVNTLNMLGGAILQQIIGTGLDLQWTGAVNEAGIRLYHASEFVNALTVLLVVLVECSLLAFKLKELPANKIEEPQN